MNSKVRIVGNEKIIKRLQALASEGCLAPSYLFSGSKGLGKFLTAVYFCASVFCDHKDEGAPCFECSACRRVFNGSHPDVRVLSCEEGRMSIGVDEVRQAIDSMQGCSYEGGFRFWIIDEAQKMTDEAQSALLKTLEEPPASLILILISQGSSALLPTVVSRCRRFEFKSVSSPILAQFLRDRGCSYEKSEVVARISGGSVGTALDFINDGELWDRRVNFLNILSEVGQMSLWQGLEAVSRVEELCAGKNSKSDMLLCLDYAAVFLRDAFCIKTGADSVIVNADCRQMLENTAVSYTCGSLERAVEEALQTKSKLEGNVNSRLAWQSFFLTLQKLAVRR